MSVVALPQPYCMPAHASLLGRRSASSYIAPCPPRCLLLLLTPSLFFWQPPLQFMQITPINQPSHFRSSLNCNMGNSQSSQSYMLRRESLQCSQSGVATFKVETLNGGPARPGYYMILCRNANINEVHVKGITCRGDITPSEFLGTM